jgi:circadian clock protein KaiC
MYGLEMHLVNMHKHIENRRATSVVVDPVTSLMTAGNLAETRSLLVRLIDLLKGRGITAYLTSLTTGGSAEETSDVGISSLIDTWIVLSDSRVSGERNRTLQIVKSRGMAHSNQVREFLLSGKGVRLREVYLGQQGVLTGSARLAQEAVDRAQESGRRLEAERQEIALVAEEKALAAQISASQAKLQALTNERERLSRVARQRVGQVARDLEEMAMSRRGDTNGDEKGRKRGR